jgi:hypothetical protein
MGDCNGEEGKSILGGQGAGRMGRRMGEAARRPQVMVIKKQEEVKPVKYIEVELDSDDEGGETSTGGH